MAKKWQEIEFLDFKERAVRRREREGRTVAVQRQEASGRAFALKMVFAGALLAVVAVGGFMAFQEHLRDLTAAFGSRGGFQVKQFEGDVEISTATRASSVPKPGERFDDTFTVKQGDTGRTALELHWKQCRVVVQGKARVDISKVEIPKDTTDKFRIRITVNQGIVLVELRTGTPLAEIRVPQGSVVKGGRGLYKVNCDENETQVIVRDGFVRVTSSDSARNEKVGADQRLVIKKGEEWGKATSFSTPETVWK